MADEKMDLDAESEEVLGEVKVRINGVQTYIDEHLKPGQAVVFEVHGYVRWQNKGHLEGKGIQKELVVQATTVKFQP